MSGRWPGRCNPGVILAASLAGLPISSLIALTFPGLLLSLGLGWLLILRPGVLPLPRLVAEVAEKACWRDILREGLPLLVAILGAVGLEMLIGALWPELPFEAGMCAALALSIAVALAQNPGGFRLLLAALTGRAFLSMLFVIVGIFGYQDVLEQSGAVARIAELTGGAAALALTTGLLPLLVGLVTGITVGLCGRDLPADSGHGRQCGSGPAALRGPGDVFRLCGACWPRPCTSASCSPASISPRTWAGSGDALCCPRPWSSPPGTSTTSCCAEARKQGRTASRSCGGEKLAPSTLKVFSTMNRAPGSWVKTISSSRLSWMLLITDMRMSRSQPV